MEGIGFLLSTIYNMAMPFIKFEKFNFDILLFLVIRVRIIQVSRDQCMSRA